MSYYKDLLVANNNTAVPLWQFKVSNTLLYDLIAYFKGLRKLNEVDSRDCSLFYALWWKYEYLDGKPSKETIYSSINNKAFTAEEFYQKAKEGGT